MKKNTTKDQIYLLRITFKKKGVEITSGEVVGQDDALTDRYTINSALKTLGITHKNAAKLEYWMADDVTKTMRIIKQLG